MGRICIDLFTSLDGVAQAPGGPEEDEDDGFTFGGWQAPLIDEVVGEQVLSGMSRMDALLLGRKTYDIFAGYWPEQQGEIADLFNRIPKYVATRQNIPLPWADSAPLGSNTGAAVQDLRRRHERIHVIGSLNFVQTLLADQLFDQLTLWVHPILLGPGKRVFADGAVPTNLQLLEPAVTSPRGVVRLRYELVGGVPATGDMSAQ